MTKLKEKILLGTQQILVGNGFEGTDIDSVLKQARINKGTFYSVFKTKDELLNAIIEFESAKLFSKLDELFSSSFNPLSTLNAFLDWKLKNFNTNSNMLAKFGSEFVAREIQLKKKIKKIYGDYTSYIVSLLEAAVENGQLNASTPVRELANFIVFSLEGGRMSVDLTSSRDQFADVTNMIKRVIRTYRNLDDITVA